MIIKFNYHEPFTYSIENAVTIRVTYSLSVMRGGTQKTENYLLASPFSLKKKYIKYNERVSFDITTKIYFLIIFDFLLKMARWFPQIISQESQIQKKI